MICGFVLFRPMFLLAVQAFLRIEEITVSSSIMTNKIIIDLNEIEITLIPSSLTITCTFSILSTSLQNFSQVRLVANIRNPCIVSIMSKYLSLRDYAPGPLFVFNGKPVSQSFFKNIFQSALCATGLNNTHIKTHSFRIGAVTTALMKGYTYPQIQQMGRWKSQAFKNYIRVPSFKL